MYVKGKYFVLVKYHLQNAFLSVKIDMMYCRRWSHVYDNFKDVSLKWCMYICIYNTTDVNNLCVYFQLIIYTVLNIAPAKYRNKDARTHIINIKYYCQIDSYR